MSNIPQSKLESVIDLKEEAWKGGATSLSTCLEPSSFDLNLVFVVKNPLKYV